MNPSTVICQLGPTSTAVVTNHDFVIDHLSDFYVTSAGSSSQVSADWTVHALLGEPAPTVATNEWGVGYAAQPEVQQIWLWGLDLANLAITTRKVVREVMVDYCEQRRYVMLHASAVVDDNRVLVVVGDKGSGKTTLALKAALLHGMRYLSNDHLIVHACDGGNPSMSNLTLTSLPTPIPLKIGTYLDLEKYLPEPWDTEGLDIDAHRRVPREQLYGLDRRVLYTFRRLGQQSPIAVDLTDTHAGRPVLVALGNYTRGSVREVPIEDAVEALMPHVRTDWMFDPRLNQRHLPRHERDEIEYWDDARRLVEAFAGRATVIGWNHRGDPRELLEHAGLRGSPS
ncbi:DEAD/DEAH box helicase family protein [Nocardia nepalensis]|uniref:DEAD/DEAH box helicase family protein n=1 Tax=Nocardia nepalensis TaxID=3375448 RepID=UPI003B67FD5A